MKKSVLLGTLIAAVFLAAGAAFAAGPDGQSGKSNTGHLYLYEKNPSDWTVVSGGAWGKLKYDVSGPAFGVDFNGHGLVAGQDYTLIYYPDKAGNPWPRTDIICLGSDTANNGGNVHIASSTDTGSLPNTAVDINAGAKIWLVESGDVNCTTSTMSGWNPAEYLFENDLISYTETP